MILRLLTSIFLAAITANATELHFAFGKTVAIDPENVSVAADGSRQITLAGQRTVTIGSDLIVRVASPAVLDVIEAQWHPETRETLSENTYLLIFTGSEDVLTLCDRIAGFKDVLYAQPNFRIHKQMR